MQAVERGRDPADSKTDDGFDALVRVFSGRLHSEREHLVSLSAALARADEEPRAAFEALRSCAHRMHGAAAIFDFDELARAAHALECGADAALRNGAPNTDAEVWTALVGLVQFLDTRRAPAPSAGALAS
jgi:chemotaxis protein histidine kinase CheA